MRARAHCGFPARDVALYTVWYLRGCAPVKVWKRQELLDRLLLIEKNQALKNRTKEVRAEFEPTNWFDKFITGLHRQSRRILDNLGLIMKVEVGYLIYCLQYDINPGSISWDDRRRAFIEQALRNI